MNSQRDRLGRTDAMGRRAFTLIELLVVVLIILVLAGLLFPALIHAQKMARIRKAKSEAADLAKAWESFWDMYQQWPMPEATWFEMDAGNVAILAGLDSSVNTNSKKFMIFSDRQLSAGFKDPWKGLYRVKRQGATVQMQQQYRTRAYMANVRRYASQ